MDIEYVSTCLSHIFKHSSQIASVAVTNPLKLAGCRRKRAPNASLALFGNGDAEKRVRLAGARAVRRFDELHRREYQSEAGTFELERVIYGTREGQKTEHVSVDERLQLPEGKQPYLSQDWDQ